MSLSMCTSPYFFPLLLPKGNYCLEFGVYYFKNTLYFYCIYTSYVLCLQTSHELYLLNILQPAFFLHAMCLRLIYADTSTTNPF